MKSAISRIAAVTAVVVAATAFGAAAQTASAAPVAAVADPSWSDLPRVKEDARIAATQARVLRGTIRTLDTDLATSRASAQVATAALVDAQYALPDPASVAPSTDDDAPADTQATQLIPVVIASADAVSSTVVPSASPVMAVQPEASVAAESVRPLDAPAAATPEQRYTDALAAKKAADAALAHHEIDAAERQAQLTFLLSEHADAVELRAKALATAERKVEQEATARLAAEKARKAAEEAARVAAAQAAQAAAEEAARQAWLDRWVDPAAGGISDTYGPRAVICAGGGCSSAFHGGTDVATGCGSPVYAAHAGTVSSAGASGTLGNLVQIDHGNGVATGYAHLSAFNVGSGQGVGAGDLIGWSGTTGASTGCHLHFEVYVGGEKVDPQPFFADRGTAIG